MVFGHSSSSLKSASRGENVDDEDDYDDGNRNIILSLIGQLRPGSDLSRITLPTFILERKSMLERITNLLQHPQMIIEANNFLNPEQRFIEVVKWYMSGWHIAPKAVKKPLNPVLGEVFSCYWDVEEGQQRPGSRAYYMAEQTSHHPPKSSYFFSYPERQIRADGIVIPVSKFLGNSAASLMEGVAKLSFGEHVDQHGQPETYEITQPNIYARNVLVGTLKLEIGDKAEIRCPALGMEFFVEFKVKGYISGTYNEIKGTIFRRGQPLYELSGKWNEVIYIQELPKGKKEVFFDTTKDKLLQKPQVRPLEEQYELESRRLWYRVCVALGERNQKVATDEKFEIEDHQRQLQKLRESGQAPPFHTKLFAPSNSQLQFDICCDKALRRARCPAEVEHILQNLMPILPGTPLPANFEDAAADKAKMYQQGAPQSSKGSQSSQGHANGPSAPNGGPNGEALGGCSAGGPQINYNGDDLDEFEDARER